MENLRSDVNSIPAWQSFLTPKKPHPGAGYGLRLHLSFLAVMQPLLPCSYAVILLETHMKHMSGPLGAGRVGPPTVGCAVGGPDRAPSVAQYESSDPRNAMNIPWLLLIAGLPNLLTGVILVVIGLKGNVAARRWAKLICALGLIVVITNLLWGLAGFVDGTSEAPNKPSHFEVSVHNASTGLLKQVVVRFLGQHVDLFDISAGRASGNSYIKRPPSEKIAVEWNDDQGTHRSKDLPVPPYPTTADRGSKRCLQVQWHGPDAQTVQWD